VRDVTVDFPTLAAGCTGQQKTYGRDHGPQLHVVGPHPLTRSRQGRPKGNKRVAALSAHRTWQLHRQSSAKRVKADIEFDAAEVRIADKTACCWCSDVHVGGTIESRRALRQCSKPSPKRSFVHGWMGQIRTGHSPRGSLTSHMRTKPTDATAALASPRFFVRGLDAIFR
jgi:hypothetical protein